MLFRFAQYVDVTKIAKKVNENFEAEGYKRVFLCEDTKVFWLARLLEGFDEEYEPKEGSFIVERDKIPKEFKGEKLSLFSAKRILQEDIGDNWDYHVYDSEEAAIAAIDGGHGIKIL